MSVTVRMALTEAAIRDAKPKNGKEYALSDGDGLVLLVGVGGAKRWAIRYWVNGRERRYGLGGYPEVGLTEARDLKLKFKRELALGNNLQDKRKAEREVLVKERVAKVMTFERVAEDWYKQQSLEWSASRSKDIRHKLNVYILPKLRDRLVKEVTAEEVLVLVRSIAGEKPETAKKCKGSISQILRFAMERGNVDVDVTAELKGIFK